MKIHFIAQSGFIIEENDIRICIDVWSNNPLNPISLDSIPKIDHVFITHDHKDHDLEFGIQIAKRDNAVFHSNYDIAIYAQEQGVINAQKANIGGSYKINSIEVVLVHAEHSSDKGVPVGFVIKIGDRTLYHMGDTGYFKGFDFLKEIYSPDVVLIPIGSRYTMGPIEASFAIKDMQPEYVIPMHYNTSDAIKQDVNEFVDLCRQRSVNSKVIPMNPGKIIEI